MSEPTPRTDYNLRGLVIPTPFVEFTCLLERELAASRAAEQKANERADQAEAKNIALTKAIENLKECLDQAEAREEALRVDAERLRNGEIIGFRNDDNKGRAWWSGGTWLNKGQQVVVVDAAIDAARKP